MNTGIFGEGFPYSNFHDLNMDWIIKIAKDFLDQYTHIQEIIEQGKTDIQDLTTSGLAQLQDKADTLEGLLQAWYNEHSADIADQLEDALSDLNSWYNTHSEDIATELASAISSLDARLAADVASFLAQADAKTAESIASIPADYSALSADVEYLKGNTIDFETRDLQIVANSAWNSDATEPAYISMAGYYRNKTPITYIRDAVFATNATSTTFIAYDASFTKTGVYSNYYDIPASTKYFVFYAQEEITYAYYDKFANFMDRCNNKLAITFQQGNVNTSAYDDGSNTDVGDIFPATNRAVSDYIYLESDEILNVKTLNEYTFNIAWYNNDWTYNSLTSGWLHSYVNTPVTRICRIIARKNDNSTITGTEAQNNTGIFIVHTPKFNIAYAEYTINKYLHENLFNRIRSDVTFALQHEKTKFFYNVTFEQANISTNPEQDYGEKYTVYNRLTSENMLDVRNFRYLHIHIREGYKFIIYKYDDNQDLIGSSGFITDLDNDHYVGDCAYVYLTIAWSDGTTKISARYGEIALVSAYAVNPPYYSTWNNKKWVSYGDSITNDSKWQPYVAKELGLNSTVIGLSGARIGEYSEDGTHYTDWLGSDTNISQIPTDTDVITIMGGTNDFGGNPTPLGDAEYDYTNHKFDTHTFQGSLAEICRKIYNRVPTAKIFLMSIPAGQFTSEDYEMPQRVNALGYTGLDYAKACKDVADLLNLPYVDTWNMGVNVFNRSYYMTDTVHPNAEGGKMLASVVTGKLKEYAPVNLLY